MCSPALPLPAPSGPYPPGALARNLLRSCCVTSTTTELWSSCLRAFMMRTMAASIWGLRSSSIWQQQGGGRGGGTDGTLLRDTHVCKTHTCQLNTCC
jgi:hypothetical protein